MPGNLGFWEGGRGSQNRTPRELSLQPTSHIPSPIELRQQQDGFCLVWVPACSVGSTHTHRHTYTKVPSHPWDPREGPTPTACTTDFVSLGQGHPARDCRRSSTRHPHQAGSVASAYPQYIPNPIRASRCPLTTSGSFYCEFRARQTDSHINFSKMELVKET